MGETTFVCLELCLHAPQRQVVVCGRVTVNNALNLIRHLHLFWEGDPISTDFKTVSYFRLNGLYECIFVFDFYVNTLSKKDIRK